MILNIKQFNNCKRWGRLEFNTGKIVILKPKELQEFETKIEYWQAIERLKMKSDKSIAEKVSN